MITYSNNICSARLLTNFFWVVALFIFFNTTIHAQGRNTNWCFGDSAGINFSNLSNPVNFKSACKTRGESATISDSSGNLLFYAGGIRIPLTGAMKTLKIFDNDNQIMNNGDSLFGDTWYETEVIVPFPDHDSLYYVFAIEEDIDGLYYNLVNKKSASDSGIVVQKNILLLKADMGLTIQAVKHGNGRDWWLVSSLAGIPSDTFYVWNISPSGITGPQKISINTFNTYGSSARKISFNSDGSKFIEISYDGLIQEHYFNRCTGNITLNRLIRAPNSPLGNWFPWFTSVAYSPNDRFVYIIQRTWIANDSLVSLYWPFPDNYFTTENSYLSVINAPDNPGSSCNFTPFSFYLGGSRTYAGLCNEPNYNLGPTADSCIFAAIAPPPNAPVAALNLLYHQQWQTVFVNANTLKGTKYTLRIYSALGKLVYEDRGKTNMYFTKDVVCTNYTAGVYIVNLETEKESLSGKFVVH